MYMCHESHLRRIFSRKSEPWVCCVALPCLFVCLCLLLSFFLLSSLIKTCILPNCPPYMIPPHTLTVSRILSILGYSGGSRVVPQYIPPHRHSVWNTKYPGILGILPICPPLHTPSQTHPGYFVFRSLCVWG